MSAPIQITLKIDRENVSDIKKIKALIDSIVEQKTSNPKPIKVTKKYTIWKSVDDFLTSEGL